MTAQEREARYREAERRLWRTVGLEPTERHVPLRTTGTTVRVQEVGEGEPTLFLHGGPNAGSTWAPLAPYLPGLRCLLVDRPGTGLSEPFALTVENLPEVGARFVRDILEGLGIDRAHVVASSLGGHLALRSAAATPERFRRMVQMARPALTGDTLPPFMRLMTRRWVRRLVGALPPNERAARMIFRQIGHGTSLDEGRIPPWFIDWYVALQRHTETMRHDGDVIGRAIPRRAEVELDASFLATVGVPTLFLWGADDTFGGEAAAREVSGAMPEATLRMIPHAGHLPWLDFPEPIGEATAGFLLHVSDLATTEVES